MTEYAALLTELSALTPLAKSETVAPVAVEAPAKPAEPEAKAEAPEAPAAEAEGAGEAPAAPEAKEGEAAEGEAEAKEGEAAEEAEEVDGEVAKSMRVTMPDGTEVEGVDAGPLLKALRDELDGHKAEASEMGKVVTLAAGLVKSLHGTVAAQDSLIKSLQADIARLANAGSGRKALMVAPKAPAAPAKPEGDILTKALAAQKAGRITGAEVSRIVAYTTRGLSVPEDLAAQLAAL